MCSYFSQTLFEIKKIVNTIINLRKKKKCDALVKKINADDKVADNRHKLPQKIISSILFLDTLDCFGDALFINGIIHQLNIIHPNIQITISTSKKLSTIYATSICKIIDLSAPLPKADVIIDLCYSDNALFDFRIKKLQSSHSFIITCSRLLANAKIFSAHFDFLKTKHFGERAQQITSSIHKICVNQIDNILPNTAINAKESNRILFPFLPRTTNKPIKNNLIYINTEGRTADRNLSPEQLDYIAKHLSKHFPEISAIVYSNNQKSIELIKQYSHLTLAHTQNFLDACHLVENSILTITPDTSIVHVASAYNIPVIALYCGNDLEYFREHPTSEIWAPLSQQKTLITPLVFGLDQVPINKIDPIKITKAMDRLLPQLISHNQ